jgi:two-component system cell cycle sensor histidine kinase PleC
LRESEVRIPGLVDDCIAMMQRRAAENGVALKSDLPAGLPSLFADALKLKQVLLNLISNAVKFTPPDGKVTVTAHYRRGGLVLAVSDTGIGMRMEDIPVALSPFGQVASAFARNHDGVGLGLPLAQRLTEQHQGRLEIESRPGVGTTVRVHFPPERVLAAALATPA